MEQFARIEHLMPMPRKKPTISNYDFLCALLYVIENGCKWRTLPKEYGNWHTVYVKFNRWSKNGTIERIFESLQTENIIDIRTEIVWDSVDCVCLTHKNGGFSSYGSKNAVYNTSYPLMQSICEDTLQYVYPDRTGAKTGSRYSGFTVGTTELIFLIDRENDCVYYFKIVDKTHITITKRRTFLKSVTILDNEYSKRPMMCNYLATINNLSEPVTKTADKTMKITYILQED